MTEDRSPKASEESTTAASAARQRKKRKWDQPAEPLVSAAIAVPGVTLGVNGVLGVAIPGAMTLSGALLTNPVPATLATASHLLQPPSIPQSAALIVQKLNQPKIQEELIAREIVINDAEPTVRYRLTRRQTQEEIQKCTGAVVITRGKYRPPNGPPDNEKPLYLHISAGSHLKDTAERIKAVDHAASMVEEILKHGQNSQPASTAFSSVFSDGQVLQPLSTCLYLGFDPDPSLNIAARIRGPNDQYINHIINETGASVVLRGRGSGNLDSSHSEVAQQPLHLYLSGSNMKILENAKILAENLLDTICTEYRVSRISSSKVYTAVPPPQQLLVGVENSVKVSDVSTNPAAGLTCAATGSTTATQSFAPIGDPSCISSNLSSPGTTLQSGGMFIQESTTNVDSYAPISASRTCYRGYDGIYPQATPLQQVALALRQSPVANVSVVSSTASVTGTKPKSNSSSNVEEEKRPPQKRKFQELPVTAKGSTTLDQNSQQGSEFLKPGSEDSGVVSVSSTSLPKKVVEHGSNLMLLPPSRNMPPPPPKFTAPQSPPKIDSSNPVMNKSSPLPPPSSAMLPPPPKFSSLPKVENGNLLVKKSSVEPVSDTLLKLVEYGEEDDDTDTEELPKRNPTSNVTSKPFWAV